MVEKTYVPTIDKIKAYEWDRDLQALRQNCDLYENVYPAP